MNKMMNNASDNIESNVLDSKRYIDEKDSRTDSFEEFRNQCEASTVLTQLIKKSISGRELLTVNECNVKSDAFSELWDDFKIVFSGCSKLYNVIKRYGDQAVAIITGVSKIHPGGGVLRGEISCEAEICRYSTLYFSIQEKSIQEDFYENDNKMRCVYLPRVLFFDKATQLENTDVIRADVYITDVLPDFNAREDYRRIMSLKLFTILNDAKSRGIKTLVVCDEQRDIWGISVD